MNEYQPHVGRVLKELRESRLLSQEMAAEAARMSKKTLLKIESGKSVRPIVYGRICELLGGYDDVKRRAIEKRSEDGTALASPMPLMAPATQVPTATPVTLPGASHAPSYPDSMARHLRHIDAVIRSKFKTLETPTRRDTNNRRKNEFSSSKLIASLTTLGIPVETSLHLLDDLPAALEQLVGDGEKLSTNHLRSAVARLIEGLPPDTVLPSDFLYFSEEMQSEGRVSGPSPDELKAEWALRYARRYGAGERAIQVLDRNGGLTDLNYNFLKDVLFPDVLNRLLGDSFSLERNGIISKEIVGRMARGALEEFTRLGLYTIRYKTVLRIAEDLALHPPHPWIVIRETRETSIEYDLTKARENIARLVDPLEGERASVDYRNGEALRHIASAILGIYSGYLGNRETSPLQLLDRTLKLENDNRVLWDHCQLRLIDGDLNAIDVSKHDLANQITRLQIPNDDPPAALAQRCQSFLHVAERLLEQRNRMEEVEAALRAGRTASEAEMIALARETVITCLGVRKLRPIVDRSRSREVGLIGSIRNQDSVLQHRSPSIIFLLCPDPQDDVATTNLMLLAVDQLAAHQASRTVLMLCGSEPDEMLAEKVRKARQSLNGDELLSYTAIAALRRHRNNNLSFSDIIDELFN
jgi:DNA-binding XRE family transcriptional regulator